MVKLSGEIDESASDVGVYGLVLWRLPSTRCGEQCSPVSLGQPMVTVRPQEKARYMDWSMRLIPTYKVSTDLKDARLCRAHILWRSRCAEEMCSVEHPEKGAVTSVEDGHDVQVTWRAAYARPHMFVSVSGDVV